MSRILTLVMLLISFNIFADEVWLIQKSHHYGTCDSPKYCGTEGNGYNETHPSIGYHNDESNKFVYVFINSYSKPVVAVGHKFSWYDDELLEPNIKLGVVYGYGDRVKNYKGFAAFPLLGLDINLTENHTIAFNTLPTEFISVGYVYKW